MATITAQQILGPPAGTTVTFSAATSSDQFLADDDLVLHVKNGGGSTITVTIVDAGNTPAGSAASNPTFTVAAGTEKEYRVPAQTVNPNTGFITVNYSATASVTAALKRV